MKGALEATSGKLGQAALPPPATTLNHDDAFGQVFPQKVHR